MTKQQELLDKCKAAEYGDIVTIGGIDYETFCELQYQGVPWVQMLDSTVVSPYWITPNGDDTFDITDDCCYPVDTSFGEEKLKELIDEACREHPIITDRKGIYDELIRMNLVDPELTPYE